MSAGPVPPPPPTLPTGPVITVKPSGGDFSTISAAAAVAKPGDTVLISGGVYPEALVPPHDGTVDAPITFQAVPGDKVVIYGNGTLGAGTPTVRNGLVNLDDRSNITMIGISVQGSGSHGIYAERATNIVLRDCEVAGSLDGGIVFLQSSQVKVQRCDVHGNNARGLSATNEAVSFDHTQGFEISFSTVHDNGEEGIDAKYDSGAGMIFNNDARFNRGPNIYIDSANGVQVFDNVVSGTGEQTKSGIGLAVESLSDTKLCANISIYNNVVTNNEGGGIGFYIESVGTFANISIVNNTVVGNHRPGLNAYNGVFTGTNILRNNIFTKNQHGDATSGASAFTADHNIFTKDGVGSVVPGKVKFVSDEDLRLKPGSAGIGAGSTDGAPGFDINGVPRTGTIDLGAYQSLGSSVPQP